MQVLLPLAAGAIAYLKGVTPNLTLIVATFKTQFNGDGHTLRDGIITLHALSARACNVNRMYSGPRQADTGSAQTLLWLASARRRTNIGIFWVADCWIRA